MPGAARKGKNTGSHRFLAHGAGASAARPCEDGPGAALAQMAVAWGTGQGRQGTVLSRTDAEVAGAHPHCNADRLVRADGLAVLVAAACNAQPR